MALLVRERSGLDPLDGAAVVFRAGRADRIKVLIRDRTGMVLVCTRLDGAKFVWPRMRDGVMSPAQFPAEHRHLVRPGRAQRPELAGQLRRDDSGPLPPEALRRRHGHPLDMSDTALAAETARLKARLAGTGAALAEAVEAPRRLQSIVSALRRDKSGARSEKLDPEQVDLPLGGEPLERH